MPSTPKGAKFKSRNGHEGFKATVRRGVACGPDDDVLEVLAGDGRMFTHCWKSAGCGATMDIEISCCELAAKERTGWAVVKCNAETAMRSGIWRERAFTIVDVDCYGSPWKFVAAFFLCRRSMPDSWTLVLTDHYMLKRNLSHEDKVLGFRKPGSPEHYLDCVDRLLSRLAHGWNSDRKTYRDGVCVQHVVTLRRVSVASDNSEQSLHPVSSPAR